MSAVVVIALVLGLLVVVSAALFVGRRRTRAGAGPSSRDDLATLERIRAREIEAPSKAPPEIIVEKAPVEERIRPSLRDRLAKSRKFLADRLADALRGAPDVETWEELEAGLIQADIGVETATRIVEDLKEKARERRLTDAREVRALLAEELVSLFDEHQGRALNFAALGVTIWLVVGVNGTGKTTTIGKLASDLRVRGKSVVFAAADTFRAAADEQLDIWAQRTGADLVRHQTGADPGAVAYDGYQHARAQSADVLIVDTAGRLHTKRPLMDELAKIRRVLEKEATVHESFLVIDATGGQNGLAQARKFAEATGVTGVILTKLDGTARGGIALTIEDSLGIPIKLVGIGEGAEDLEPFDPKMFVDALLS